MDLSTGPQIDAVRGRILDAATVPVGTVPIYQVAEQIDDIVDMRPRDFLGRGGPAGPAGRRLHDRSTPRCFASVPLCDGSHDRHCQPRRLAGGQVDDGGTSENPFYTHFDDLCDIMREYDVTWSLGDGLRPGSIADASDDRATGRAESDGGFARLCTRVRNCQVMIEGPGHVPIDQIERNVRLEQEWCDEAPFYVLGPFVTDISPGYDHVTAPSARRWRRGTARRCFVT